LSLFAFAAKANSAAETALIHPASELAFDVGNDAFLEPIAIGESDVSVGLAADDAEQASSALLEEEVACDVYIEMYEWSYTEQWEDEDGIQYSYTETGYSVDIYIKC